MMDKKIEEAYRRYGYITKTIDGIQVYEYKQGRYFGADIINNGDEEKIKKIQKDYQQLNYSTLVRDYKTTKEAEDELFKSFFQLSSFRATLNRRYENFVKKQMEGLPETAKYKYINSNYTFSNYDSDGIITTLTEMEHESVVEHVTQLLNTETEPLLVIIEAAAGYGKTCTAYEIIKNIEQSNSEILPFYIELSRNREARIFKHILQNEIDEQFQNVVKSDVVLHQIKQGNIPIIIDGFDELLSKDLTANTSQLRDIESMLSTIVNLLEFKAKIVITSRKTAIFSGEEFYDWIRNTTNKYTVARFSISEPTVENWLNEERVDILKSSHFPIDNVANPVLLSYIRNIDIKELKELVESSKNIVDKYFEFLLRREQIRQELFLDEEKQLRIFKKLVRIMTEFDIKAENKSFIKDILKDYNRNILDEYIKTYPKLPKPTLDEVTDTLSNHALLDRKQNDNIGFINEFIFGILIGRNLIEEKYQEHYKDDYTNIITQDFAYLAISSFKVQPADRRDTLWHIFHDNSFPYDDKFKFHRDYYLKNEFIDCYKDILIEEMAFKGMVFGHGQQFYRSIFSNCKFFNCKFNGLSFAESGFINCQFYDCQWVDDSHCKNDNVYLTGCSSNNDFEDKLYEHDELPQSDINIEEFILRMFVNSSRIRSMRKLSLMKDSLKKQNISLKEIENAINSLKNQSYIVINGDMCFIQKQGISHFNNTYNHE